MTLLPVRVPAGDKAAVGAVGPGNRSSGIDLPRIAAKSVGQASVLEYASAVGAGFGLPPSAVGGPGITAVSVGNPVTGQYWPRGQDEQS